MVKAFQERLETASNSRLSKDTALERLQRGVMAAQASLLSKVGACIEQIHILVSIINRLNELKRLRCRVECVVEDSVK